MKNLGDFAVNTVVYGKFTTYRPSSGATYTLGGTPALKVYKDNSTTTETTTGVTLTVDFDNVTGLNHFTIDTSTDGSFYASGSFFQIVITTGTVDSISVVGAEVGCFTLEKVSSLRPTTAGKTLDVSNGGEAGIDWANVGTPGSTVNLSATTTNLVNTVTTYTGNTVQTGDSFARIGATGSGLTTITAKTDNLPASPASTTNITAATGIDITKILGTSISAPATAGILDVNVKNIKNATTAGAAGYVGLDWGNITAPTTTVVLSGTTVGVATTVTNQLTAAQIATGVWQDTTAGDFTTSASIGKSVMNGVALGTGLTINAYTGNTVQTGDSFARIGLAGAGLTNIDLPNQTMDIVGNITGNLSGSVGSVTGLTASNLDATVSSRLASGSYTTPPTANANADALLDRAAGVETGMTFRQAMRLISSVLLGKIANSATTTNTFRDINDSKDRVVSTVDSDGNRSAVTLDAS